MKITPDDFDRLLLGPPIGRSAFFWLTPVFIVLYALAVAALFAFFLALIVIAVLVRLVSWLAHIVWLALVCGWAFARICWLLLRAR